MKFNRIISCVLFVSLLFSMVAATNVFAEEKLELPNTNNVREASILCSLGLTDAPDEKLVWENETITNRQFLSCVLNMSAYDGGQYYNPILPTDEVSTTDTDYNKYVYVYSKGWFKTQTGIGPENPLTMDFAMTLLKGVLGYTQLIENGASDLDNYVSYKLVNGVKVSEDGTISLNSALKMLANAIDIPYCNADLYSNTFATWDIDENITVLSVNKNIFKIKGRVLSTHFATLSGETVGKNHIRIGNEVYEIADKSFNSYIGKNVTGYAFVDNDVKKVLYLENAFDTYEIVINGEDFASYTPDAVTYYTESGKTRTLAVKEPVIIYNGKQLQVGEYSDSLFDIREGTVTLLENNGVVDVIIITKYQNLVVGTVDRDLLIVTDMIYENSINFDCDEYSLKSESGKELTVENLKKGNVITYARSLDEEYIVAVVGGKNVQEKITGLEKTDEDKYDYLEMGNVGYYTAAEFADSNDTIVLGDVYDLYINVNGKIVAAKSPSGLNVNLAYITNAVVHPFTGLAKLKLYTPDSVDDTDYIVLDCAKSVRIDGTPAKGNQIVSALKMYDGTLTIPITYTLNIKGEISVIDTPNYVKSKERDNSLVPRVSRKDPINVVSTISYGYRNHFGARYYLTYDGMCINHPSKDQTTHSSEKKEELVIVNRVRTKTNRNVDLYSLGYDTPIVYFAIADDNSSDDPSKVEWENSIVIVKEISTNLKDNEIEGTFITILDNGTELLLEVSEQYKNSILSRIDKYDIMRYKLDARGEIIDVEQVLDYSNLDASIGRESISWQNYEYRYVVGKCYDVTEDPGCTNSSNKTILSFYKDASDIEGSMECTYLKNSQIYTVVRDEIKTEECSPDLIKTYKGATNNADIVLLITTWNAVPSAVYIIRKG